LTGIALYLLFRLVGPPIVAGAAALIFASSPSNLTALLSLRDYSKAPFALLALGILGAALLHARSLRTASGLAMAYGLVVGIGFGFRTDLLIMAPFGIIVFATCLPGAWTDHWRRNLAAGVVVAAAFAAAGAPALRGLKSAGGCQYHYALLGLTTPLSHALNVEQTIYRFGDHLLDTFVDLKVGDYAQRNLDLAAPNLCVPDYDLASGKLFFQLARTFPADLVVRAYLSLIDILRDAAVLPSLPSGYGHLAVISPLFDRLDPLTHSIRLAGPLVTAFAVGAVWSVEPRLGLALAVTVLFLGGYPAIQFEDRHWFHLRFLPWWSALAIVAVFWSARGSSLSRRAVTMVAMSAIVMGLMVVALGLFRIYQTRTASAFIESYLAAKTEPLPIHRPSLSAVDVEWTSIDYGESPNHRESDLAVLAVAPDGCGATGPVDVRVRYAADVPTHDLSTTTRVVRGAHGDTQVFVPIFSQGIFDHSYLRFTGFDVPGRPADCLRAVSRVSDRKALPVWIDVQVPPDWRQRPLHESLRLPARFLP
jgi:hypothetical protein